VASAHSDHRIGRADHEPVAQLAQARRHGDLDPAIGGIAIRTGQYAQRVAALGAGSPARGLHHPTEPSGDHHRTRRGQSRADLLGAQELTR
jgi:hypothetical protein